MKSRYTLIKVKVAYWQNSISNYYIYIYLKIDIFFIVLIPYFERGRHAALNL